MVCVIFKNVILLFYRGALRQNNAKKSLATLNPPYSYRIYKFTYLFIYLFIYLLLPWSYAKQWGFRPSQLTSLSENVGAASPATGNCCPALYRKILTIFIHSYNYPRDCTLRYVHTSWGSRTYLCTSLSLQPSYSGFGCRAVQHRLRLSAVSAEELHGQHGRSAAGN